MTTSDTVPTLVAEFLDRFTRGSDPVDAHVLTGCFAEAFLAGDANGARMVPRAAFLEALPRRRELFDNAGVGAAALDNYTYAEQRRPTAKGKAMPTQITDEYMNEMRAKTKSYTLVLLKRTPLLDEPGAMTTVWEHGRRNYMLHAAGVLSIVCPTPDDSELAGIGIFNTNPDEVARLMAEDPGVKAGLFTYTLHTCLGFPGDALGS